MIVSDKKVSANEGSFYVFRGSTIGYPELLSWSMNYNNKENWLADIRKGYKGPGKYIVVQTVEIIDVEEASVDAKGV